MSDDKPWTIEPATTPMTDTELEDMEKHIWHDCHDVGAEYAVAEIKRLRLEIRALRGEAGEVVT